MARLLVGNVAQQCWTDGVSGVEALCARRSREFRLERRPYGFMCLPTDAPCVLVAPGPPSARTQRMNDFYKCDLETMTWAQIPGVGESRKTNQRRVCTSVV